MNAEEIFERRVGTTLDGKYRLEQLLGVGGMAAVYRGTHRNGNRVAIKLLHAGISTHAEMRDRFLREGYVANRVEHPGAVRVLDDDTTDDGLVFLVMELLEGETLDARWLAAGQHLPCADVADWTYQLLDVLAAAHDKNIVHRDIKPENLFLTRAGVLKVLDFGIARLADSSLSGSATATQSGHVLGTPVFLSPEQALGRTREIDGQTDLWAVGATMFALISGRYVHEGETLEEVIVRAGSRQARPLASVAPDVPLALAAVVDRALKFDRSERWADARAMQKALAEARKVEPVASALAGSVARSQPPPPEPPPPISEGRRAPPTSTTAGVEGRLGQRVAHARALVPRWVAVVAALAVPAIWLIRARSSTLERAPEQAMAGTKPSSPVLAAQSTPAPEAPAASLSALDPSVDTAALKGSEAPGPLGDAKAAKTPETRGPSGPSQPTAATRNQADHGDRGASAPSANVLEDERVVDEVLSGLRGAPSASAPAGPAALAKAGVGFLNVNSIPPSICFVDGRKLGATPRVHIAVPAGTHQVTFMTSDPAESKTLSVTVADGETKTAVTKLDP